jgi:hypothetical protein
LRDRRRPDWNVTWWMLRPASRAVSSSSFMVKEPNAVPRRDCAAWEGDRRATPAASPDRGTPLGRFFPLARGGGLDGPSSCGTCPRLPSAHSKRATTRSSGSTAAYQTGPRARRCAPEARYSAGGAP